MPRPHDLQSPFSVQSFENWSMTGFIGLGEAGDSACIAQSEATLKEDINRRWLGTEMTSGWDNQRSWVKRGGWGDEVRVSALKLCQEVCVWANELGEEALSQEPRPREGPVVLASPPRTHVTMVRTPPPHWSHNMCTTRVHMRVYTQGCDAKYPWHQITPKNCRDILISKKEKKKIRSEETKFKFVHVNDTLAERCTFEVIY